MVTTWGSMKTGNQNRKEEKNFLVNVDVEKPRYLKLRSEKDCLRSDASEISSPNGKRIFGYEESDEATDDCFTLTYKIHEPFSFEGCEDLGPFNCEEVKSTFSLP
ncbi:hypothetical protein K1719_004502 [Acacia pycnantha]|nr:hypothetical protein K1719_004502 [Acacia pycnantha]